MQEVIREDHALCQMGENFYYPTWELIIICSLCSILEIHCSNYFARFDRLINLNLKVEVL